MKKVTNFAMVRFNNAYHVNFHSNVIAMIEQYGEDSIGISTSMIKSYKESIALETDAVKRSMSASETKALREADAKRDNGFRYVRNILNNLQYSTNPTDQVLYEMAKEKILNIYPSTIPDESDNEESAHIRGFILDVRNYFKNDLEKLGISAALTALEDANDKLQEQYITRAENKASVGNEFTKKCRNAVDEAYQMIIVRIEYTGQLTELTDESSVMVRQTCERFIDALNALIARTWQSIVSIR